MSADCSVLRLVLREPERMAALDGDTWDFLVRHAEASGTLGRLGALAREAGLMEILPAPVARYLVAALNLAEQQRRSVLWELTQIRQTLGDLPGPVVLLKGAAYAAGNLPPAAGRLFTDIDMMVPVSLIGETESRLKLTGWTSDYHDAYDERYYREWMHEIPPLRHLHRGTVLDLHHSILPRTARLKTRPELLLEAAVPLPNQPGYFVLDSADQVLHSATHLYHEGEWEHGLRDLVDLDALLRAYGREVGFWDRLLARAEILNLGRPLYYALRHSALLLSTPVPERVIMACPKRPGPLGASVMDPLFVTAFTTNYSACRQSMTGIVDFILYIRSHWLRMPVMLLLPHLLRKAWIKRRNAALKNRQESRENDSTRTL